MISFKSRETPELAFKYILSPLPLYLFRFQLVFVHEFLQATTENVERGKDRVMIFTKIPRRNICHRTVICGMRFSYNHN